MGIKIYRWWCPQCGRTKRTLRNKAPLCKGSKNPQQGWWHLFAYRMEKEVVMEPISNRAAERIVRHGTKAR